MLRHALALLAPPRCGACAAPCPADSPICTQCAIALAAAPGGAFALPGVGTVRWAAPYAGVARELVAGLKFGRRLPLAGVLAAAIAATLSPDPPPAVVAVPAAPGRRRRRGFDPAESIAGELARAVGLARAAPLRRANGPRQVGRRRTERLAAPPRVWPAGPTPARVLLIDDVLTTGATLTACAAALRRAGASEVEGAVFARALGEPGAAA